MILLAPKTITVPCSTARSVCVFAGDKGKFLSRRQSTLSRPSGPLWSFSLLFSRGFPAAHFAASLAAYYQQIPLGRVEAGLRTSDLYSPARKQARFLPAFTDPTYLRPLIQSRPGACSLRGGWSASELRDSSNQTMLLLATVSRIAPTRSGMPVMNNANSTRAVLVTRASRCVAMMYMAGHLLCAGDISAPQPNHLPIAGRAPGDEELL